MGKPMTKRKIVAALARGVRHPEEDVGRLPGGAGGDGAPRGQVTEFTIPWRREARGPHYKARVGRNPRPGEEMRIPARRLKFVEARPRRTPRSGGK
jgi:hypothetical protein